MKKDDIIAGGVYADGKQGLRRVLRLDVPAADLQYGGEQSEDKDFLEYEVLHARSATPTYRGDAPAFCTRASMATWAKARIEEDQVPATLATLIAQNTRITPAAQVLLRRLHAAQAGRPHVQALTGRERSTAGTLAFQKLLIMPSGGGSARLAPAGEVWIKLDSEKDAALPRPRSRRP